MKYVKAYSMKTGGCHTAMQKNDTIYLEIGNVMHVMVPVRGVTEMCFRIDGKLYKAVKENKDKTDQLGLFDW